MSKRKIARPLVLISLLFLVIFFITILVVQFRAKKMVADFLYRKLPAHVQLDYLEMDVNVWKGNIALKDIAIGLYDRDSMLMNTEVTMEALSLNGLSYWQFFVKKNIDVEKLWLQKPRIDHYLYKVVSKEDTERQGVVQLLKTIEIRALKVTDGQLRLYQRGLDSVAFKADSINFDLMGARTGPKLIRERIPIAYGRYDLSSKNLYVNLGPFEELRVGELLLKDGNASLGNLDLHSKFGKEALSKRIETQHDHISLKIPETTLDSIRVSFKKDTLFIATGAGKINQPSAEIYRDKLVAEDKTHKRLYSRMLRELPIYIDIPKIQILNGLLVYSEQVETIVEPGEITFNEIDAVLSNIANYKKGQSNVTVTADALLMDHAPIELDWHFDVFTKNDAFMVSGAIERFKTASVNDFLESNLRAKAKGIIDNMYFTISGDVISSAGDMKMRYDDFEFSVLKKNRLGVNKLLTAIGRLFINDGSNADENGFRYGEIEVERDPTKSFFNYIWLNVREGTVNTMVGRGKK